MKASCCLIAAALLAAGAVAGPVPAPDSLLGVAETDTLTEFVLGVVPPEGVSAPYSYQVDWGDGTTLDWPEDLPIRMTAYYLHQYDRPGTYEVRVRLRDAEQRESEWSRPLPVVVTEPRKKWLFQTLDPVIGSPALDEDGNIYIGDDTGWLYSVGPDGMLRWGFETGDAIFSAAVLDHRHVYVGSLDSNFYCLDREHGRLVWKLNLGEEIYTPPAVDARGNLVIATDGDRVVAVRPDRRVIWPRRRVLWQFEVGEEITGSPSIGPDGSIYVASESLYCLDGRGRPRWVFGGAGDEFFFGSPVPDPDGNVYIAGTEGGIYAVGPDGSLLWQAVAPDEDAVIVELVAGEDGAFWFGTESGYLCRLDPPSGTSGARVRIAYETFDLIPAAAAVSDKGTVYFVSEDGWLYALRSDGRMLWRSEIAVTEKDTYYASSPVIGPDGTVYVGSWDGGLFAFRGDGPPAASFWPQYRRDFWNSGRLDR